MLEALGHLRHLPEILPAKRDIQQMSTAMMQRGLHPRLLDS
jgi:hypothetical protein